MIISGNIDLSVGSILGLTAAIGVVVFNSTYSIFITLLATVGMGFLLGLFNGIFVGIAKVAAFIVHAGNPRRIPFHHHSVWRRGTADCQ